MADVNANIGVHIDTSDALAQLKSLQRQISQFHTSIARSSEAAALAQRSFQTNLINSINSIGAFSAELRTISTTAESFSNSLERNKFSMREYFRYSMGATRSFGRFFRAESETLATVAEERVKRLQTQYIKMGRDASGAMKAIAVMPAALNMDDLATKTQLAAQKQAVLTQLIKQGSTNLLNFGKNTQWAGRQLMVGFTIPLTMLGSVASRAFMDMETAAIKFRKVYGDLFTPAEETKFALDNIKSLASEFTKYGISAAQTMSLAADAAAAGFKAADLQAQTAQATRLSVLGQIDQQKALETTISLQNAFGTSAENLADSINFLNAVENQTVTSLDDITTAIPKVAPVIKQLGGDVKDLAYFLTAMKEGGINASEGANALKSGLASMINPTKKAKDMLASVGISMDQILQRNKGNLRATVVEFANALNELEPLSRSRVIEQMFGKFQFARISALFNNITKEGTQASRVLDLANASVGDLAATAEKELGITANSAMNKFKKAIEDLKITIAPVGELFLKIVTPFIEKLGGIIDWFNGLNDKTKRVIGKIILVIGGIGPVVLMTFGLLSNALANIVKAGAILRNGWLRLTGQSNKLGQQTRYLTMDQLDAAAAAHSLEQSHARLTQEFNVEASAVERLRDAYERATIAAVKFAGLNPAMFIPGQRYTSSGRPAKYASGIVSVPGPKGAGDVVPAMLSPGEAVIPADMAKKYGGLINGMIADNIPGYVNGKGSRQRNTSIRSLESNFSDTVSGHLMGFTPSELGSTIGSLGDDVEDVEIHLWTLSDVLEDGTRHITKTTAKLSDLAQYSDKDILAGGEVFGGTTVPTNKARNAAYENIRIDGKKLSSGDPFTLKQVEQLGLRAIDAKKQNTNLTEEQNLILEQLIQEGKEATILLNSANSLDEQISFIKERVSQSMTASYNANNQMTDANGDLLSSTQKRVLIEQRIASVEAELLEAKRRGVSGQEILTLAEKKYAKLLLSSGTGEYVVAPRGTGGGPARDAAARAGGRSNSPIIRIDQKEGERRMPYRGGSIKRAMATAYYDSQMLIEEESSRFASGAIESFKNGIRRALRMRSPSVELTNAGEQAGESILGGVRSTVDDGKIVGEALGDAITGGAYVGGTSGGQISPQSSALAGSAMIAAASAMGRPTVAIPGRRGSDGRPTFQAENVTSAGGLFLANSSGSVTGFHEFGSGGGGGGGNNPPNDPPNDNEYNGPNRRGLGETSRKFNDFNSMLMTGTFALTALAGMGSMAEGKMGKLSETVMKLSGYMFAFSAIMQLVNQDMIRNRVLSRANKLGMLTPEGKLINGFSGGIKNAGGNLKTLGLNVAKFLGPWGMAATAVTALGVGIWALNKKVNEEREKLKKQIKAETEARLGSFKSIQAYGKIIKKSLPSQRTFSRNNRQRVNAPAKQVDAATQYYDSKVGKKLYEQVLKAAATSKTSAIDLIAKDIAERSAVYGLSPKEILGNIGAAGKEFGFDEMEIKGKVISLLSPDGTDITKTPITVEARIKYLEKSSEESLKVAEKSLKGLGLANQSSSNPLFASSLPGAQVNGNILSYKGTNTPINSQTESGLIRAGMLDPQASGSASLTGLQAQNNESTSNFAYNQGQAYSAMISVSNALNSQTEALALLNGQYADGSISSEEYQKRLKGMTVDFNKIRNTMRKTLKELNKYDDSGQLAAEAMKEFQDQTLAALKAADPDKFNRVTTALENIKGVGSQGLKIDLMIGYKQGSVTAEDLILIPSILSGIDGKSYSASIELILNSGLGDVAAIGLQIQRAQLEIENLRESGKSLRGEEARNNALNIAGLEGEIKRLEQKRKTLLAIDKPEGGTGGGGGKTLTEDEKKKKALNALLALLDKEIARINEKREAQKALNDEMKRQNDYTQKQLDLSNSITKAKISGDYLGAAAMSQEKIFAASEFNAESADLALESQQNYLEKIKDKVENGGKLSKAENSTISLLKSGKFTAPTPNLPIQYPMVGTGFVPRGIQGPSFPSINGAGGISAYGGSGSVYNTITMNISGANANEIADQVIKKLNIISQKNGTKNKVGG